VRCDGCNYLKSLDVRLSPQAVIYEFRLFAGDSLIAVSVFFLSTIIEINNANPVAKYK